MAEFCVRIAGMERAAGSFQEYGQRVGDLHSELLQIRNGIQMKGGSGEAIREQVSQISHALAGESSGAFQLSTALARAASAYQTSENRILDIETAAGYGLGEAAPNVDPATGPAGEETNWWAKTLEGIFKGIGELGVSGSTAALVVNWLLYGVMDEIPGLNAGKDLGKVLGKLGEAAEKLSEEDILKLAEKLDVDEDQLKAVLKKIGGSKGFLGKIGAGLSGTFTGLLNVSENYDEFGGITWRGSAETVLETVIDVAADWALPVVGSAAAGLIGAPAAAGAVVISVLWWGADTVIEAVSGRDMTEIVTDFIIDEIGGGISAAWDGITTAWGEFSSGVSDWWNSFWD